MIRRAPEPAKKNQRHSVNLLRGSLSARLAPSRSARGATLRARWQPSTTRRTLERAQIARLAAAAARRTHLRLGARARGTSSARNVALGRRRHRPPTRHGSPTSHSADERRRDGERDGPSHHAERGVDGADVGRRVPSPARSGRASRAEPRWRPPWPPWSGRHSGSPSSARRGAAHATRPRPIVPRGRPRPRRSPPRGARERSSGRRRAGPPRDPDTRGRPPGSRSSRPPCSRRGRPTRRRARRRARRAGRRRSSTRARASYR